MGNPKIGLQEILQEVNCAPHRRQITISVRLLSKMEIMFFVIFQLGFVNRKGFSQATNFILKSPKRGLLMLKLKLMNYELTLLMLEQRQDLDDEGISLMMEQEWAYISPKPQSDCKEDREPRTKYR